MENYRFITIGIGHYRFLPHLDGAEATFWSLQRFLRNDLGLSEKQALLFTDNTKLGQGKAIYPNRHNLLKSTSKVPNIIYFQGYGSQSNGQSYLLPIDADPQNLDNTALNLRSLLEKFEVSNNSPALLILDLISSEGSNPVSGQTLLEARQRGISLIVRFNQFQENLGELASALGDAFHYYQDALNLDLLEFFLRDRLDHREENPLIILSPNISSRQQALLPRKLNAPIPPLRIPQPRPVTLRSRPQALGKPINFSFRDLPRSLKLGVIFLTIPLVLLAIALFTLRSSRKLAQSPSSPKPDQTIFEEAKIHLKRHQASDFIRAISELRKISPQSPVYPEAQTRITFWSQTILEIAQGRAEVGNWQDAIAAAKLVPRDQSSIYAIAQQGIRDWQEKLTQLPDL
ncbi:MAG: hypothetical protein ACKO2V_10375 [Snowella sp.]